ncbi:MAG TPA: SpoIVB peptidase [Bacillota bacterium]|nr:SpoIVB peptidase [Bacillota bacterium]
MNFCRKTMGWLVLVSVIILVFVISSAFIQSFLIPSQVKLCPGQKMELSVNYPLGLQMNRKVINPKETPEVTRNLVLNSRQNQKYQVLLKLFGSIPIKKLQVEVANPPMVIPGGQAIGVVFSSRGVVVVGMLPVTGLNRSRSFPAREAGLKPGDIILTINDIPINHVEEIEYFLRNFTEKEKKLHLTVKRNQQVLNLQIRPVLSESDSGKRYMLGIFVDDPAAGVGTLSFYDPTTMRFAGLGHQIAKIGGRNGIPFNQGEIVMASINGIRRGMPGKPGEKIGVFQGAQISMGQIKKNTRFGIYGTLNRTFLNSVSDPVPAAFNSQVNVGDAEIYTVIKGSRIEKFQVKIVKVFHQYSPRDKGMIIKVTDPVLLKETGGIIQGMSGSPIIQNGKLVGAVTHVFVNDPTKGYGVLAEWMLKEMQNRLNYPKKAS